MTIVIDDNDDYDRLWHNSKGDNDYDGNDGNDDDECNNDAINLVEV